MGCIVYKLHVLDATVPALDSLCPSHSPINGSGIGGLYVPISTQLPWLILGFRGSTLYVRDEKDAPQTSYISTQRIGEIVSDVTFNGLRGHSPSST